MTVTMTLISATQQTLTKASISLSKRRLLRQQTQLLVKKQQVESSANKDAQTKTQFARATTRKKKKKRRKMRSKPEAKPRAHKKMLATTAMVQFALLLFGPTLLVSSLQQQQQQQQVGDSQQAANLSNSDSPFAVAGSLQGAESGELLALGGSSLAAAGSWRARQPTLGSAKLASQGSPAKAPVEPKTKLDYVVEFMRSHQLTAFADKLASRRAPLANVSGALNALPHFTIFAPLDGPLEGSLEGSSANDANSSYRDAAAAAFILRHASGSLVAPGRGELASGRPAMTVRSLSGATYLAQQASPSGELSIGGARVLAGRSHALQAPHAGATYAIVHAIDRPLDGADEAPGAAVAPAPPAAPAAQLEREQPASSRQAAAARRTARSELVPENNRNFYRPSLQPGSAQTGVASMSSMPAHLAGSSSLSQPVAFGEMLLSSELARNATTHRNASTAAAAGEQQQPVSFESANRYKVVLDAAARHALRSQQRAAQLAAASGGPKPAVFAYDELIGTRRQSTPDSAGNRTVGAPETSTQRSYSPLGQSASNDQQAASSALRMIKFEPQDARDFGAKSELVGNATGARLPAPSSKQAALDSKAAASPQTACAFYDADCKRAWARLVRLPAAQAAARRAKTSAATKAGSSSGEQQAAGKTALTAEPFFMGPQLVLEASKQPALAGFVHFDSSFGEHLQPAAGGHPSRQSPLALPLPPWTASDEAVRGNLRLLWRNPDPDLARLRSAGKQPQQQGHGFAAGLARARLNSSSPALANTKTAFDAYQFHRPTPVSISHLTTHRPLMFAGGGGQKAPHTAPPAPVKARVHFAGNAAHSSPAQAHRQRAQQQQLVIVQLKQPGDSGTSQGALLMGDMLVTAAGGVSPLAEQASSVRHARLREPPPLGAADALLAPTPATGNESLDSELASGDFFQNRTISEIMDDSGLRIDGAQVTFSRVKACLAAAGLLGFVDESGAGNRLVTFFMPTDDAYERLVQQHALAQSTASRLPFDADHASRQLPLLAAPAAAPQLGGLAAPASVPPASKALSLDCGSSKARRLLLDHLSAQLVVPRLLERDVAVASVGGKQLLLSSVPAKKIVVVNGQPVIAATRAKNGMVYVVNKFLNVSEQPANVVDLLRRQPQLSTFASYLRFSGLEERLKREIGPITVLAPTNDAFEQLGTSVRQLINSDQAALQDLLRGHIVEGAQYGKLVSMRSSFKTLNTDQSIDAKVLKPNVYMLDNQMSAIKLVGTTDNGVVNAIDRLIVPSWLIPNSSANRIAELPALASGRPQLVRDSAAHDTAPLHARAVDGSSSQAAAPRWASSEARSPFLRLAGVPPPRAPTAVSGSTLASTGEQQQPPSGPKTAANATRNMRLVEKLASLMQARAFLKYLQASNLGDSLKPDVNYVILAPTDAALEKLPKQIVAMLDGDERKLADLVHYHVLDTTFEYINTVPDGSSLSTLNDKDIVFNWHKNSTVLTASGAIVLGGVQEENIAVLVVDRVLYPTPGDLLAIISKSPILTNFTAIVRSAGLDEQLSRAGPFTLFAPADFAFAADGRRPLAVSKETARSFLLRHLSQPALFTASIALHSNATGAAEPGGGGGANAALTISNLLGEDLRLRQRNDYFLVNDVNFSYADVAATNGVIHVIDGIL